MSANRGKNFFLVLPPRAAQTPGDYAKYRPGLAHPLVAIYASAAACKHAETRLLQTPSKKREDRKQEGMEGGGEKKERKKAGNGGALFIILA